MDANAIKKRKGRVNDPPFHLERERGAKKDSNLRPSAETAEIVLPPLVDGIVARRNRNQHGCFVHDQAMPESGRNDKCRSQRQRRGPFKAFLSKLHSEGARRQNEEFVSLRMHFLIRIVHIPRRAHLMKCQDESIYQIGICPGVPEEFSRFRMRPHGPVPCQINATARQADGGRGLRVQFRYHVFGFFFFDKCLRGANTPFQVAVSRKSVIRSSLGAIPFFWRTMPALPR